ncbi:aminotransferase [Crenobacter luteus]|uniref:Aminotransferase n=1 Tax=Crenobacter luteus TaxID=1452487 RepID=A0A165ENQ1_9NEIS|nr:aminotransferase [Crenobacter luteus]KZE27301.1 aminotransferase [Crenobacter luteus]
MSTADLSLRDRAALLHPTTHLGRHAAQGPLIIERGEGIHVWDSEGRRYIEGMAGLWCAALGYGVPELAEAAAEQVRKLSYSHLFGSKSHEPAILLAEKLKELAPFSAGKVFFGHSGSDANDTQIKLIWYYNNLIGRPEKKKIIARDRAYHGVTLGAATLTGLAVNHKGFDLPLDYVRRVRCPHFYREGLPGETEEEFSTRLADELEALIVKEGADTIAAFIAEPVMGAGGVVVPPAGYFEKVQAVLERHDILLIDDEVICGFGRTGRWFGSQTLGMRPDTMSLAKALSSGYQPISAVLIPDSMYEVLEAGSKELGVFGHGYTYSGHPVCAAVALKNLELMQQRRVVEHAAAVADRFQSRLRAFADHPLVGEARGVGLIGAVELVSDKASRRGFAAALGVAAYCQARAEAHGLIVRAMGGDTIAFCPPLVVSEADIDELFDRFARALDDTAAWLATQR